MNRLFPRLARLPRRPVVAAMLLATLGLVAGRASAVDLTVEFTGAVPDKGRVMAAVYGSEAGWLKPSQAVQATMAGAAAKTLVVYRGLPAGRYAISAFDDENGNGKLDTNPIGLPLERYGFSRDARGMMGPPRFDDAAFELNADATIVVTLK